MAKLTLWLGILGMFLGGFSFAQGPPLSLYPHSTGTEEGLSQLHAQAFTQDSLGYIWIGTQNGLNRFDGAGFDVLKNDPDNPNSLASNDITALSTSHDGRIWIGFHTGAIQLFDPASGDFVRFDTFPGGKALLIASVYGLAEDDQHNLWASVRGGGLMKWELSTKKWTHCLFDSAKPQISKFYSAGLFGSGPNDLWVNQNNAGVYRIAQGKLQYYGPFFPYDLPVSSAPSEFNSYIPPRQKRTIIPFFLVNNLVADPDGRLIINDLDGYQISKPTFIDRQNHIWSLGGNGFSWFSQGAPMERYHPQATGKHKLPAESIRNMVRDPYRPDSLWVSTYPGLHIITHDTVIPAASQIERTGIAGTPHRIFFYNRDTVLLGSEGAEISAIDLRTETWSKPRFFSSEDHDKTISTNYAYAFLPDSSQGVWIGTFDGLYRMQRFGALETIPLRTAEGVNLETQVYSLCYDPTGRLWIGTSRGLAYLEPGQSEAVFFEISSDSPITVKSLLLGDDSQLWIGTDGLGLGQIDLKRFKGKGALPKVRFHGKPTGFPDNTVYGILADRSGKLWMSSNQGIIVMDPDQEKFWNLGVEFGLQDLEFNTCAYFQEASGKMYFGGIKGMNAFYPEKIDLHYPAQNIVLSGIKKQEQWHPIWNGGEDFPQIEVEAEELPLGLKFSYLDFGKGDSTEFAYSLGEGWHPFQQGNRLELAELEAGATQLSIRCRDRYGNWQERPQKIELFFHQPIYQKAVVQFGAAGILLLLIGLGVRFLVRRQSGLQRKASIAEQAVLERESQIKETHHRVKNNLEVVSNLLFFESAETKDPKMKALLEKSRSRIFSMASLHEAIYLKGDLSHVDLHTYFSRIIRENNIIHGDERLNVDYHLDLIDYAPLVRKAVPLGLILNELITNSYKYAFDQNHKNYFAVTLTEEDGQLRLTYKDSGPGIPAAKPVEKQKRLGMLLISEFCRQLDGKLIQLEPPKTGIMLNFPR